jgi:hypothetical protein
MPNINVDLPRVHIAGSDAHYDAHIEVGPHGLALFLAPDADYPMLDIDGTPEQLGEFVRQLQSALTARDRHIPYEDPATHRSE